MSRFSNASTVATPRKQKQTPDTVNVAGGEAFTQDDKLQLVSLLASSFTQNQYYSSGNDQIQRMVELGQKVDPLFCAKAAVYARDTMNMRSITHVLAAAVGRCAKGHEWTKAFFDKVVVRPDDMIEILAFSKATFGKNVPAAMKKGFAKAFNRFDDYQLRKYRGNGALTLVDVVRLCHPKGVDGSSIKKLVYDKLPIADTWETKVSAAGGDKDATNDAWASLLKENKLGYMALLRNLRNILNTNDSGLIEMACEQLTDPGRVAKSRQLPFRFYSAFKELAKENGSRRIQEAIDVACDLACKNLSAEFTGSTLVAVDVSGSMYSGISGRSEMTCMEAGLLFGAAVYKAIPNSDIMVWADSARMMNMPNASVIVATHMMINGAPDIGYGTNFDAVFQNAKQAYDRIVVMTDMQSWGHRGDMSALRAYKAKYKCDPWVHWFDLTGHGTAVLPTDGSKCSFIPGFSDKVIELLGKVEQDPRAIITEIEAIEL